MVPIIENLIDATLTVGSDGVGTLQAQLHAHLRTAVLNGTLAAGTKLPASRGFARQQGVSRNTVLAAYDQLIAEGYLETRRGAGTFVAADLPDNFIKVEKSASQSIGPSIPVTKPGELRQQATGMPAIDAFPMAAWARINSSAWRQAGPGLLHHTDAMGYRPLREAIATYLGSARNVRASVDQIIITSGLQQGMTLIAESLMTARDSIILEDPGYGGLLRTATACTPKLAYVPVDTFGACVPQFTQKNSLLVVSPSHQYPLGITMPTSRRMELIKWARATSSLILEDDYDSEFRYEGRPLNSLQGMSNGKHVIYGGTFSKTIFPALRLGYIVLPRHLVEPVLARREATDSFPSIMPQLALTKFISEGHFARHIRRLRKIHAARQENFVRRFKEQLSEYFTLMPSPAGLDMVAFPTDKLKKSRSKSDGKWAQAVHSAGLSALPLSSSYRLACPTHGLLLGFANFPPEKISEALTKLAHIMRSESGF